MKYQDQIYSYRLKTGKEPVAVFIDDFVHASDKYATEYNIPSACPHVEIAGDLIQALDLRFIYNLKTHGACRTEERAKALFKRAQLFKPSMLMVIAMPDGSKKYGDYWLGLYTKEKGVIHE